jgi:GntR family transcriptional regulator/MocR family aminotransferase
MISIDVKCDTPLYQQLYEQIRHEILSKHLSAGEKLPATRQLAISHGISRNTVITAYEQLELEGYIRSIKGSGYYVEALNFGESNADDTNLVKSTPLHTVLNNYDFVFNYGNLDYNCYNSKAWRKCITNAYDLIALADNSTYQMCQGSYNLRHLLCDYLYLSRGVTCTPEQIVITCGHQQSMDIISHLFDSAKFSFAMEDPGYYNAWEIMQQNSFDIVPIPVEDDGIDTCDVKVLRNALLYLTPSHQFPTGFILPINKRLEIIEWARLTDSYIIEDDYDSEFRYQNMPIPSLQSIDKNERTIYLGTFSKSMSPDLRISYMVLPGTLLPVYEKNYSHTSCTVSTLLQLALCEFIKTGEYQKHISAMRTHYKKKHDYIYNFIKQELSDKVKISGYGAGLHFLISVDTALSQSELIEKFEKNKIRIYSTEPFWIKKDCRRSNQLLMGFSSIPSDRLPEAMRAVSAVLHTV